MRPGIPFVPAAVAAVLVLSSTVYLFQDHVDEEIALKVYCAGSLLFPLEAVAEAFETTYANVDVQLEGHGSIQVIRHITELGDMSDVLLVADHSLIPLMMYNTTMPDTNQSYTDWCIRFAGNSIVLAYTNQSRYQEDLTPDNWYEVIRRPNVRFGVSNPLIDALGYRGLMVVQLAEEYYSHHTLFNGLLNAHFNPPFTRIRVNGTTSILVPELLNPQGTIAMRASSVQLLYLLESGGIDYCFLYLSTAKQYGMNYLELPVEINLGSLQHQAEYQKAQVSFEHQRFANIGLNREGKPIQYGLTIPKNAPNAETATLGATR